MGEKRVWKIHISGQWCSVAMETLKTGDVCKVFEPDGSPLYDGKNIVIEKEPYRDTNDKLTVIARV